MPGIIDSNQHLQLNPLYPASTADLPVDVLRARWEEAFARMPNRAFVYLMQGVTSMRQTSGPSSRLIDRDTEAFIGPDYNYWKLYLSDEVFDGKNDFTDDQLRFIIDKAHRHGKIVDVHTGGHNIGLRRMLAFDVDTLEHPFYGSELIEQDIIQGYVEKGVVVDTLLTVMVAVAERTADPQRFSESKYFMSMEPKDYRILMRYRDKMLFNQRNPDQSGLPLYERSSLPESSDVPSTIDVYGLQGPSYNELQKMRGVSRKNMRRFIREGAIFSLGTDTQSFLNFQQEDSNAIEFGYMVEMGMAPMDAIIAATRNGAQALGMLDDLGTIE